MQQQVSWTKIIFGSAIGTIIGYFAITLMCCICYLVLFLVFAFVGAGSTFNNSSVSSVNSINR